MTRSQATPQSSQMIWMEQRIAELEKENELLQVTHKDKVHALEIALVQLGTVRGERIGKLIANLEVARHNNEAHDRELERVIAERDKATQYWQIAEGRGDALQANLEVARHNCEAQERQNERLQALCDRLGEALEDLIFWDNGKPEFAEAHTALAAWREMKGQPWPTTPEN